MMKGQQQQKYCYQEVVTEMLTGWSGEVQNGVLRFPAGKDVWNTWVWGKLRKSNPDAGGVDG